MIELTKANPDIETLKTLIWLAGLLIGILLVIVSYFLSKQIQIPNILATSANGIDWTPIALVNEVGSPIASLTMLYAIS